MRSFQESLQEFERRRIRVVAISVDPPEVTRKHALEQGYTFTFLSDPDAGVIRMYDLLHPGAGPDGGDAARPAEFLLDSSGTVRWVDLTDSYTVRTRPAEVLASADAAGIGAGPAR